jgi:hypothetical protein
VRDGRCHGRDRGLYGGAAGRRGAADHRRSCRDS